MYLVINILESEATNMTNTCECYGDRNYTDFDYSAYFNLTFDFSNLTFMKSIAYNCIIVEGLMKFKASEDFIKVNNDLDYVCSLSPIKLEEEDLVLDVVNNYKSTPKELDYSGINITTRKRNYNFTHFACIVTNTSTNILGFGQMVINYTLINANESDARCNLIYPTEKPTEEITTKPTDEITTKPTEETTTHPTEQTTTSPSNEPTTKPTDESTSKPSDETTITPTEVTTSKPIDECTTKPSNEPSDVTTDEMTDEITEEETNEPTNEVNNKKKKKKVNVGGAIGGTIGALLLICFICIIIILYKRDEKERSDGIEMSEQNQPVSFFDITKVYPDPSEFPPPPQPQQHSESTNNNRSKEKDDVQL